MATRDLELVVQAVIAELFDKYSITDIKPQKKLEALGVKGPDLEKFKKRLYKAVSKKGDPPFREFAQKLSIGPSSSVTQVAKKLSQANERYLTVEFSEGGKRKSRAQVRAAVHTSIAQASKDYSIMEIAPSKKLRDLGLRQSDLRKVNTRIYRTLYRADEKRPPLTEFSKGSRITLSSRVNAIVGKVKYKRCAINFGLAGDEGRGGKGGFGLAGEEGRGGKGGFRPRPKRGIFDLPSGPTREKPERQEL